MEEFESNNPKGVVKSKRIRAGKRTYFIDIKKTRKEDFYLTITESKRKVEGDNASFIRQKIFLYKEDFNKVLEGLVETIEYVKTDLMPEYDFDQYDNNEEEAVAQEAPENEA